MFTVPLLNPVQVTIINIMDIILEQLYFLLVLMSDIFSIAYN